MKKIKSILCKIIGHKWTLKRKNASNLVCERCGETKPLFLGPKAKVKAAKVKGARKAVKKAGKKVVKATRGKGKKAGGRTAKVTVKRAKAPVTAGHRGRPKGSKNVKKQQSVAGGFPAEPIVSMNKEKSFDSGAAKVRMMDGTSGTPEPVKDLGALKKRQAAEKAKTVEAKVKSGRGRKPGSKNKPKVNVVPETKETQPVVDTTTPGAVEVKRRRRIAVADPRSKGAIVQTPISTPAVIDNIPAETDETPVVPQSGSDSPFEE